MVWIELLVREVDIGSILVRHEGSFRRSSSAENCLVPFALMKAYLLLPSLKDALLSANDAILPGSVRAEICIAVLSEEHIVIALRCLFQFLYLALDILLT